MIIDLTHTISPETFVYPARPAPPFLPPAPWRKTAPGKRCCKWLSHRTHMDAPVTSCRDGCGLDQLPPSQFCGRAAVLDVSHLSAGSYITADFLRQQNGYLRSADYALLYTGWEKKWGTEAFLSEPFPVLDEEAARYLVCCGLKGIGTDAISVDPLDCGEYPAHHVLLTGGLVIVENLCLKKLVGRKDVMFFALPLKYAGRRRCPCPRHRGVPGLSRKGDDGGVRRFLAILVCKVGRAVGRLIGKGSSLPGKYALKICPDILRRVQLPAHIIAVTGSNGKPPRWR